MRRHSASVANKMLSTMSSIVLFHLSHEMIFPFSIYIFTLFNSVTHHLLGSSENPLHL